MRIVKTPRDRSFAVTRITAPPSTDESYPVFLPEDSRRAQNHNCSIAEISLLMCAVLTVHAHRNYRIPHPAKAWWGMRRASFRVCGITRFL